ncbi:Pfs, NACHT and WD domain protein [Aspergillus luchuensis]|uniref:Pfs, NACHT and WD domain protein n=1 Tax=Aspergillus kawachii TaxID=1069201 RepID=A0A146FMJ7_ASPKA|nr:Pfs, NACHT and WD domain protein [Aspergillus luchuensis]
MAKPYASQPLYHSIVLPVTLEHPTAVLVQDMPTNPHTLGLWNIAHRTFHQALKGHIGGLMASVVEHGYE